ncbi:uncharacterized protein [Rutidosis leptorrhynchoides]|uniref:uncharacterized protein n=1 Tax=Rutidosis leptorrhynchoides TaxID=125765 RepID=UPI003A991378
MNRTPKQKEVHDVISENNLCVCAILESHVGVDRLRNICSKVCYHWQWASNYFHCHGGTRIILGWDPSIVSFMIISMTNQVVHGLVRVLSTGKQFFVSFVYAKNYYIARRELWMSLCMHKSFVGVHPWAMLGDFNVSLSLDESTSSGSRVTLAMREFRDCIEEFCMTDVNQTGLLFTWNQKPHNADGILKKIDRIMVNDAFLGLFVNAYAYFHPYRMSDHSPTILKSPSVTVNRAKTFRFFNFVVHKVGFEDIVLQGWRVPLIGYSMFQVVKKLRSPKKLLRKLMWNKGNLHARVLKLRHELDEVQIALDNNPFSMVLREEEGCLLMAYTDAVIEEERFLKQKVKVDWLREGDSNSGYFHKVIKGRQNRSHIASIVGPNGLLIEGSDVASVFVEHYKSFLGSSNPVQVLDDTSIFVNKVPPDKAASMIRVASATEVKAAFFDMGNNKTPGPDGYSAEFS